MRKIACCLFGLMAIFGLLVAVSMADDWEHSEGKNSWYYPQDPYSPSAHDMRLVGFNDLQGRPSYHPYVIKQGNRWILYASHHVPQDPGRGPQDNGTSILDVTNPHHQKFLVHVPSEYPAPDNEARHVRVCPVGKGFVMLRTTGQKSHDLYNVTDPAHPKFLMSIVKDLTYTHKPYWDCELGYMFLPSNLPADKWRVNYTKVYWIDPASDINAIKPEFVRNFGLVGQEPGADTTKPAPTSIHMPLGAVNHDRVYFGYGSGGNGIMQITDYGRIVGREQGMSAVPWPIPDTPANLLYPQLGRLDWPSQWGVHTVYELKAFELADFALGQVAADGVHDFAVTVSEAGGFKCSNERDITWIVDISRPDKPIPISTMQHKAAVGGNFCNKGGRFGPHSSQERFDGPFYKKLVFLAYFNAGLRVFDIRDPFAPVEVAHFVPNFNANTYFCSGTECDTRAIQTNNVDTDTRGYIYIVDRAGTGTHILELTGEAKEIISGHHH